MKLSHLDKLSAIPALSGDEKNLAEAIVKKIDGYARWAFDSIGTLYVYKEGKKRRENPFLVMTHMDEAGLLISGASDEGYLRFQTCGAIDPRFLLGRRVTVGSENIPGVIGCKAIHQTGAEERKKPVGAEKLLIDIGASTKEQAEKAAAPGDSAVFMTGFERMGGRRIRGRALGDRIGCAVMISLIRTELPYDTVFAFTTRYHSGGSEPIAVYHTRPERTLILGAAAADDIPGGKGECALGKGVVLPLSEQRTVYEKNFRRQAGRCALEKEIPVQQPVLSENSGAGRAQYAVDGVPTVFLGVPCRYLNSPAVVADEADIENMEAIALELISTGAEDEEENHD